MTPQPIPGTLLAAFQRFADLSQYWHRKHTPDSLAVQELEERHRLERDIPELIKRLTAFADVGTSHLFDVAARVKAEPPREDAGQGWRMLEDGEQSQDGDEYKRRGEDWTPLPEGHCHGGIWKRLHWPHRRRIAKDTPKDTAGNIRADYEPKREESGKACDCGASKETWRMLRAGEDINEGDLCGSDLTGWAPTNRWGGVVTEFDEGHYRRRVTPPSPAKE